MWTQRPRPVWPRNLLLTASRTQTSADRDQNVLLYKQQLLNLLHQRAGVPLAHKLGFEPARLLWLRWPLGGRTPSLTAARTQACSDRAYSVLVYSISNSYWAIESGSRGATRA
jgi:hypothetical protein